MGNKDEELIFDFLTAAEMVSKLKTVRLVACIPAVVMLFLAHV